MEELRSFILTPSSPIKKFTAHEFESGKGIEIHKVKIFKAYTRLPSSIAVTFYDKKGNAVRRPERKRPFLFQYNPATYLEMQFFINEEFLNEDSFSFLEIEMPTENLDEDFKLEVFYTFPAAVSLA